VKPDARTRERASGVAVDHASFDGAGADSRSLGTVARRKAGNLRATCSGAGIDFTLDEPAQNSLEFRLTTGPAAYCLLFGGVVSNDKPAVDAASGTFKAADAPAPGSCPISPASCEGLCGASAETCFCDAACVDNGDCCADFADFCQP